MAITTNTITLNGTVGSVKLEASNSGANYALDFPANLPSRRSIVYSDTTGTLSFIPSLFYNTTSILESGIITFRSTASSTGGRATFFPTTTNTTTGTALFTNILYASATATLNAANAIDVVFTGLNSIAGDNKSIIFNAIKGTNVGALGGASVVSAVNGTIVTCYIVGN
jgi:hypothetical protein